MSNALRSNCTIIKAMLVLSFPLLMVSSFVPEDSLIAKTAASLDNNKRSATQLNPDLTPVPDDTVQTFDVKDAGMPYTLGVHHTFPLGSPPSLAPVVLDGGPSGVGKMLRLASGSAINQNSVTFDRTNPGAHEQIVVDFDFRITPGTGRADGFGFALLNTAVYGITGAVTPELPLNVAEEPNFKSSLGVGFDIYRSSGVDEDINDNHISVHFNGAHVETFDARPALDLAEGEWAHARIIMRPGGGYSDITVLFEQSSRPPVMLIDRLRIPGFTPYEGRVYFAARSGGLAADHDIDNIRVQFLSLMNVPITDEDAQRSEHTSVPIVGDEDAQRKGHWGEVIYSEVVPIHMHLLPNGKVMYWDRYNSELGWDGIPRCWDPATGIITTTRELAYDLFRSGHTFLANGDLLVTGGHIGDTEGEDEASIYHPFTNTWTRLPQMNNGRWSPSNVTLANGDVLVMGGTYRSESESMPIVNRVPQVFEAATNTWRSLTNALHGSYPEDAEFYPFLYLAPNGKVFAAGPQRVARYLDTAGAGVWTDIATNSLIYRDYGSSVMYDDGKVLIVGGNERDPNPDEPTIVPSASAEVIDLNDSQPRWHPVASMHVTRRHLNMTLLPDGTVLATGGSSQPGFDNPAGAALNAELWNPVTEQWTLLAAQTRYRGYHSSALLLPDGRVLVGGGGHPDATGGPQYNFEIFSPPYLFQGARPMIEHAPTNVSYGQSFFLQTPDATSIDSVTWVRLGSVTHGFNQNQRINRLRFSKTTSGLDITAPDNPNLSPPGHYMVFILDTKGVPSVAKIVRLDLNQMPTISEITDQKVHPISRLPFFGNIADVIINWIISASRSLRRFDHVEWFRP